ncbi:MAG: hypothetical protein RLZZ71_716 [Bacteroidota bacterium]|jgi:hypothetical protein
MKSKIFGVLFFLMGCLHASAFQVTFKVDMTNESIDAAGVHIAGSFNDANNDGTIDNAYDAWNPGTLALSNEGNGIWAITLDLVAGSYEYKFVNGNSWSITEFFTSDLNCQNILNGNRYIIIGNENMVLPSVCWNECGVCGEGCTDPIACNYDPSATVNNGCIYPDFIPEIVSEEYEEGCIGNFAKLYPSGGNFSQIAWGPSLDVVSNIADTLTVFGYTGDYYMFVTDVNGCEITVGPVAVDVYAHTHTIVCLVTVNEISGKNQIVWEPLPSEIDYNIVILKETNSVNVFEEIGEVSINEMGSFEDVNSSPQIQSNKYSLGVRDNCSDQYYSSPLADGYSHKTIHLTANLGVSGNVNLIWSPYEGISFSSYNIYRGSVSSGLNLIATVASNNLSYTDVAPPATETLYVIEVAGLGCDPSREMMYSRSNVMNMLASDISEYSRLSFQVFPNPASTSISLKVQESDLGTQVRIYNSLGQEVLSERIASTNQMLDIENLTEGFYFMKLEGSVVRLQVVR